MADLTDRQVHARKVYEGKEVPHHSCGIAIAVTFGLEPASYQSLRKGGITGKGECGAIKAGEMVLGEYLGDPNPTGAVTDALKEGMAEYRKMLAQEGLEPLSNIVCDHLVRDYDDFWGDGRKAFCADLVEKVSGMVQRILEKRDVALKEPRIYG